MLISLWGAMYETAQETTRVFTRVNSHPITPGQNDNQVTAQKVAQWKKVKMDVLR